MSPGKLKGFALAASVFACAPLRMETRHEEPAEFAGFFGPVVGLWGQLGTSAAAVGARVGFRRFHLSNVSSAYDVGAAYAQLGGRTGKLILSNARFELFLSGPDATVRWLPTYLGYAFLGPVLALPDGGPAWADRWLSRRCPSSWSCSRSTSTWRTSARRGSPSP